MTDQGLAVGPYPAPVPANDAGAVLRAELKHRIRKGDWPEGHRLPGERTLAAEFTVSRAVVREVLQTLAFQGQIQITPARGAFVRRPDGSALSGALSPLLSTHGATVRDVLDARVVLETEVTARAAENRGGRVLERLTVLAERIDTGEDRLQQAASDLQFHSLLCQAAGNPVLTAMHRAIGPYVLFMMLRRGREHEPNGAKHTQIVEAVRVGDVQSARELAAAHLDAPKAYFGPDIDRPVDEVAAENLRRISGGFWNLEDVVRQAFAELDALIAETEET